MFMPDEQPATPCSPSNTPFFCFYSQDAACSKRLVLRGSVLRLSLSSHLQTSAWPWAIPYSYRQRITGNTRVASNLSRVTLRRCGEASPPNRLEVRLLPGGVALKSLAAGPPTLVSVRSATNGTTTAEHIRTTGGNPLTFLVRTNGESSHRFDLAPRYARKSKIVNVTHNPKRFADGDTITLSTVVIDIESGDTLRTLPQNQRSSIRSWTIAFGIEAQAPGGPRGTYADGYVFSRGDFVRLKYTESDIGLSGSVGFGDYPLESDRYVFYVEPASPE